MNPLDGHGPCDGNFTWRLEKRHFQRDRVRGSINGWEAPQLSAMHNMMNYCHEEIDNNDNGFGGCVDNVAMSQPNDGISSERTHMLSKSNTLLPIDDLDIICESSRRRKCSKVQTLAKNDLSENIWRRHEQVFNV